MPTWLFRIWSPCPEKCCNSKEQLLFLACLTLKTKTLRSFEMLRTTHPATQRHNPADWNIFYTRILPAEKIKIPCLGCDRVQFDRRGCLRGWDHLHQHGQSQLHTITPQQTIPNTTSTAQCLQCRNTVAWFYLFLHTVLNRYFYYHHMFLYIFFASLNYTSSLPNASSVNAQFIFQFSSKSLTYRNLMTPLGI